jgi:FtsP/CotA-like multicopper oxidase with cupredoxin domain
MSKGIFCFFTTSSQPDGKVHLSNFCRNIQEVTMKKFLKYFLSILLVAVLVTGGYGFYEYKQSVIPSSMNMGSMESNAIPITKLISPTTNAPVKTFNITAQEADINLGNGKMIKAWTFNGSVPGPEIRVTQGDKVVVHLSNKLNVGVTIHWHGVNVPGAMDGIAGVTQDQVKPGQSFTYSFIADQAGTYWYHSHQDSSNEIERGLYGVLVVEPKQASQHYDRDYSVAFHEWNTTGSSDEGMGGMHMGSMSGMDMGSSSNNSMAGMNMGSMDMSALKPRN